ncbi:MAG: hypothetical protein JSV92_05035 [archaeon]|nr:MAG: hypothetical protein JSV92_05035 [archaeon]
MKSKDYSKVLEKQVKSGNPDIQKLYEDTLDYIDGKKAGKNFKFYAGILERDGIIIEVKKIDKTYLNAIDMCLGKKDREGKVIKDSGVKKFPDLVSKPSLEKSIKSAEMNNGNFNDCYIWIGPSAYFKWNERGLCGVKAQMDAGIDVGIVSCDIDIFGNIIEATPKSFINCLNFKKIHKKIKKHSYPLKDFEIFKETISRLDKVIRDYNKR